MELDSRRQDHKDQGLKGKRNKNSSRKGVNAGILRSIEEEEKLRGKVELMTLSELGPKEAEDKRGGPRRCTRKESSHVCLRTRHEKSALIMGVDQKFHDPEIRSYPFYVDVYAVSCSV